MSLTWSGLDQCQYSRSADGGDEWQMGEMNGSVGQMGASRVAE